VFTEFHTHQIRTISECKLLNPLKFWTTGEIDTKEGVAIIEGLEHLIVPLNSSEVGTPQVDLNGADGEAVIHQPLPQRL